MKKIISPSLLSADFGNLQAACEMINASEAEWLHFDVMDGSFVPRLGLHPEIISAIKSISKLPIDVHLMIDNPDFFIPELIKAGADIIVVHAESTKHLHRSIKLIRDGGAKAGVALNPGTSLSVLDYLLDDINLVMLMAINPGIVGHKLIPRALDKISELKEKLEKYPNMIIEIDGGVTPESAPNMINRGANLLVCGTSIIFKPNVDLSKKVKEVRKEINLKLAEVQ